MDFKSGTISEREKIDGAAKIDGGARKKTRTGGQNAFISIFSELRLVNTHFILPPPLSSVRRR